MSSSGRYPKPDACWGCPLHGIGHAYVPGAGPFSDLVFLGEAPGYDEAQMGAPFVGAAGGMHTRILRKNDLSREAFRHENVLRCVPPGFEIQKVWAEAAAAHCAPYRQEALAQAKVIVALGQTAIRAALGLWNHAEQPVKVENYHGTVHQLPTGQIVVPTFHPSYLQRGAVNLLGVVSFDLQVALEALAGTYQPDPIEPIIDPPIDWFRAYIDQYIADLRDQPRLWLAVDIETPDKEKGKSEDELDESSKSFQITRVNFAYHPDQGVTVPHDREYICEIRRLIAAASVIVGWNFDYDSKRLLAAGHPFRAEVLDGMWYAHHLQSNIPLGLGFWAPFYSRHGAWKHLFASAPGPYAAYDGPQTLRTVRGIVQDLQASGQWDVAYRHTTHYMNDVLKPATTVGIHVDRPTLDTFEQHLTEEARYRLTQIQNLVPEALRPLTPKEGLRRPPPAGTKHPKARTINTRTGAALANAEDLDPLKLDLYGFYAEIVERQVERPILVCKSCGEIEIQARHRCVDKSLTPQLVSEKRLVTRYFWREPFNPDSPPQVLAYMKAMKHKPGRNKKTKKDSTDRETLQRLRMTTRNPADPKAPNFYGLLLDLRAIGKVRGTYAIGVRKRLDGESRFHPTFTLRPSTLRNSAVAPNIQNVVGDSADKNLASGFRACVQATPGAPEWTKDWTPEQLAEYL